MSNSKRPTHPTSTAGTPAGTKVIIAAIAVLCVLAVVFIGVWVADDGDEESATPTAGAASNTPTEAGSPGACVKPPPPPASPKTFDRVPDESLAEGTVWQATIMTNCGGITVDLFGDKAPQTVASFIRLARAGYWADSPCHRLVTSGIFVLQCGDPTGSGSGNPGYGYGVENAPRNGVYPRGTLAMARTQDPNTNGGQWFIVYDKTELPDPTGYSIFGKVTKGMDIIDAIADAGNAADGVAPAEPISILDVTVEKKG